ncbi:MAG: histidine--tRNA ligase [Candidatus Micrarchaeota archaeon]
MIPMSSKSTPKGMRDFLPEDMILRNEVFAKIEAVYRKYGYRPLETPAMEYLETLRAKAGEDIEGEIFEIVSGSGKKQNTEKSENGENSENKIGKNEYGLRFDLTVPLARVASNTAEPKPFKRYCISNVWRKEEPQRGRFREFWQADIDVIGSKSMRAEAEVLSVARESLVGFGFENPRILLNNRKIMDAIVDDLDMGDNINDILRVLDKTDKIGEAAVRVELEGIIGKKATKTVLELVKMSGENEDKLRAVENVCPEGVAELREIVSLCDSAGFEVVVDLAMVRGLGYYTGPVFEIKLSDGIGTIAGGGRYDKLLGLYGQPDCAIGISIGIERLITLIKERNAKNNSGGTAKTYTKVFVGCVKPEFYNYAAKVAGEFRAAGIATETDLNERNLRKQMDYANSLGMPFFAVVGEREAKENKITLKDMKSGKEDFVFVKDAIERLVKFE